MNITILVKGVVSNIKESDTYLSFTLIANKGYRENAHPIYLKCFAFKQTMETLLKADVKTGSRLSIVGELKNNHYEKDNVVYNCNSIIVHNWEFCPIVNNQTIIVDAIGNVVADINCNANKTAGNLSLACDQTTKTGNTICNFINFKAFGDMINRLEKANVNKGKALHMVGDFDRIAYQGKDNKKHFIDEIVLLSFDFVTYTSETKKSDAKNETTNLQPKKVDSRIIQNTQIHKRNENQENKSENGNNTYLYLDMSGDLPF